MKYYLIEKDEKIVDTPQLVNWYSKLNVENVKMGSYHKINNRLVLEMKDNKDVYFPEVLFHPCFMISKKIKEIVKLYEPTMLYKEIILLDSKNGKTDLYYIPYLKNIDCLVEEKTKFGNYKGNIEKVVISREKVGDDCIFYLSYNGTKYYVVRHDLLESLIRRDAIVSISELELV